MVPYNESLASQADDAITTLLTVIETLDSAEHPLPFDMIMAIAGLDNMIRVNRKVLKETRGRAIAAAVNWEGDDLHCDHCNRQIEPVYGTVEDSVD